MYCGWMFMACQQFTRALHECGSSGAGSRSDRALSSTQRGRSEHRLVASLVVQLLLRTPHRDSTRSVLDETHRCRGGETYGVSASTSKPCHRHCAARHARPDKGERISCSPPEPQSRRRSPRAKLHRLDRGRWLLRAQCPALGPRETEADCTQGTPKEPGL